MTMNVATPWLVYQTDGVQTSYPYDFYLKAAADLAVYWADQLLPPGMYTVTGVGSPDGGTVVLPQPLPPGEVVLRRQTPQNQLTDYIEGDAFPADSHEMGLDRLTVLVQDVYETLSRASLLGVTTGTAHRWLVLPDPLPNTVLGWDAAAAQWTLYPFGVTQIPIDPVSGIGWGKNTIEVQPVAGSAQASGLLFPAGVLAVAVTAWVETTLGQSQGLQQVTMGTVGLPDCWGTLPGLTATMETTAGVFLGYTGKPQPQGGMITLTAYDGLFDGTGTVYLTGHFMVFRAAQQLGYSFHAGAPDDSQPLPPVNVPLASELEPGILELATQAEVATGADDVRAVTPLKLATRLAALPSASETTPGLVELATAAETTTGTDTTRATHPAGVKAALAATVPAGTPLSVARYASSGQALEAAQGVFTTAHPGQLVLGGNHSALETTSLVIAEQDGSTILTLTSGGVSGGSNSSGLTSRSCRGTLAAPQAVQTGDLLGFVGFTGSDGTSYGGNRSVIQAVAEEPWTASTQGSSLRFGTTTTGTTTRLERVRLDPSGNLLLGLSTAGTSLTKGLVIARGTEPTAAHPADAVQTWVKDRGGVAGKASLHVRTEDGTAHCLGDLSGIGTLCDATLGSGASYQALSVKGSQLFVGQSSTQERPQALIVSTWTTSTDATRQGRLSLNVYDAVAAREVIRMEADGSTAKLSFFAAAAVAKPTVTGSRGGNAALASALTALASLGLLTDSSSA
jgi:hypothetical protein